MTGMTSHRRNFRHAGTETGTDSRLSLLTDVKFAAATPVAAVAIAAAILSYGHIEALALAHHQTITQARLLPFVVDFLIVAGSVIVLFGYWLGWLCVVAGVAGTVFANIESGLPYGAMSATIAAWPAIAFTVASFVLERWLKRQASVQRSALEAEHAARESAEAAIETVRAELEAAHAEQAATTAEFASVRAELAKVTAEAERPLPEPVKTPPRRPEVPVVDLDAEHRILSLHADGQLNAREAIIQLIRAGHTPSQAGPLVNRSDSYSRGIGRDLKKLAAASVNGNGHRP